MPRPWRCLHFWFFTVEAAALTLRELLGGTALPAGAARKGLRALPLTERTPLPGPLPALRGEGIAEATASVRTTHGQLGEPSLPSQFWWLQFYLNRSNTGSSSQLHYAAAYEALDFSGAFLQIWHSYGA
jgi:hypothetical protein